MPVRPLSVCSWRRNYPIFINLSLFVIGMNTSESCIITWLSLSTLQNTPNQNIISIATYTRFHVTFCGNSMHLVIMNFRTFIMEIVKLKTMGVRILDIRGSYILKKGIHELRMQTNSLRFTAGKLTGFMVILRKKIHFLKIH